ncbi:hypothetical protein [uncultured Tateyamaria sp.]|uniref:DUF883 family protein n=1 Tax=uncultured Tateyamaria sp. TaxID=455651 RepID=UPI002602A303|nr:hypothetical protein [uncultured Tateyamaria sp.]
MAQTQTHSETSTKNGLDKTLDNAQAKMSDLADKARSEADVLQETIKDVAWNSAQQVQDTAERVQEHAQTAGKQAADAVRRNPGLAVAGALGIGVLLGLAVARRG